ncbi:MAG TPA: hypothetical protein VEW03_07600 [Longimicrobiaceae bacterium]|nr:hypothetical protein [Longimicrobiaceae bacterium]
MRSLVLATLLAAAPLSLLAQPGRTVPVPRAVAEDIAARARAEGADAQDERRDAVQVLRFTEARERDLNGDGRPELFVTGTGPLCGANNCTFWVYGREGGGRVRRLLETGGVRLDPERTAARGFRDLRGVAHMSAAQSFHTVYRYDGRAYAEVATEIHGRDGLLARIAYPLAAPGQPRHVTLAALPVGRGSALRLSAAYTGCVPGRATPGRLCGQLDLGLAGTGAAGRALPAPGPGCFTLEVAPLDDSPRHSSRVACEAASVSRRTGGRALALRLTPEAWEAVAKAFEVRLVAGGNTLRIEDPARQGLAVFVDRVYELNGMELYPQD